MSKHNKIDIADFRVKGDHKVDLADWPTQVKPFYDSKDAYKDMLEAGTERLSELQEMLYAHDRYSMLVKDGKVVRAAGDVAVPMVPKW